MQVCIDAYIPYFKLNASNFCCPLFFEEYLNPQVKISKMGNEHTVYYHPSPSELTSRIHLLIYQWSPKRLISQEFSWIISQTCIFLSDRILSGALEKFQVYGIKIALRLLEDTFVRQKIDWIFSFLHNPPSKTLHFTRKEFSENLFSPSRKGGGLWSWKKDQN